LLSSLVHSLLHRKRKAAESTDDGDDDCSVEETAADLDHMLRSLVDRMMKCEPEDFELVHCTTSLPSVIHNIASVLEFYCDHLKRNILAHDNYELFFSSPLKPAVAIMGTAIKHLVPDRVKPPGLIVRVPGCQKLQMAA